MTIKMLFLRFFPDTEQNRERLWLTTEKRVVMMMKFVVVSSL